MPAKPKGQSAPPANFEIKSAQLSLVALLAKTDSWFEIAADLQRQYGAQSDNPEFFENDPLVLDFSALPRDAECGDISPLLQALRDCRLLPVAFRGEPAGWTAELQHQGLAQAPAEVPKPEKPPAPPVMTEVVKEVIKEVVREVPGPQTMVVDKPLRSGQKVYARGADLVVLAPVNQGAEVVADGNIHVYAPLRGKAMAGARGNANARIFSLCLEPELISIAGVYRTSENPLPADVAGKPAQVRLSSEGGQDKLLIESLKT
jgi:septum site-determining protein MinC